jgi:hypothetical protein
MRESKIHWLELQRYPILASFMWTLISFYFLTECYWLYTTLYSKWLDSKGRMLLETEWRLTGPGMGEMGRCWSNGENFQFCKKNKFWMCNIQLITTYYIWRSLREWNLNVTTTKINKYKR